MNPTAVFWMLEGPQVLRSEAESASAASGGRGVGAKLTAEAIWLLLEGSGFRVVTPVHRAA